MNFIESWLCNKRLKRTEVEDEDEDEDEAEDCQEKDVTKNRKAAEGQERIDVCAANTCF